MSKIWLLLNVALAVYIGIISFSNVFAEVESKENHLATPVSQEPLTMEVILETHYIDGNVEKEYTEEKILSMQDFWSAYEEWQVVEQKEGAIRFRKEIDDISPFIKAHGYFGIRDGALTIFEGIPMDNAAIQSFYQIDTEELETHLYEDLKNGIKIETKNDYLQVLETFRSYQNIEAVNS